MGNIECLKEIEGLDKLVAGREYRQGLGLAQEVTEDYELLAQGEYNRNYVFTHPVWGRRLLLRVNFGSQMHLTDQILYEYQALTFLEKSGRTPKVFYVDDSKTYLEQGILVMECLPGQALDYHKDLETAARILSDIHQVRLCPEEKRALIRPDNGLKAILEECESMISIYMESDLAPVAKKSKLRSMLDHGWSLLEQTSLESPCECCINTELNSTNFLINREGRSYLIDWEKPLLGDPAQDLGHFLAPTTTFWKTDVILTAREAEAFIDTYCRLVGETFDTRGLKDRVMVYIPITCLRGITWCAMAWVQYQEPGKAIVNQSTMKKLEDYLDDNYLDMILREYLGVCRTSYKD